MNAERQPTRRIVRPNRKPAPVSELQEFEARQDDGLTDDRLSPEELRVVERQSRDLLWPRSL